MKTLSDMVWGNMRIFDEKEFHDPKKLANFLLWLHESGITSFDSADIYGKYEVESHFGKALAQLPLPRDSFQIISKASVKLTTYKAERVSLNHYDTTAKHIKLSLEKSLKDLGVDYLDVFLMHRPDPLMDPNELAPCLDKLYQEGKFRKLGISNYTNSQWDLLQSKLSIPIFTNQVEFSLQHLAPIYDGCFDKMLQNNLRPMVWSPLAGGKAFSDNKLTKLMENMAKKYDIEVSALILAWLMKHPSRPIPVIGSNKKERISAMIKAKDILITREDWFQILVAAQGHPVP